MSNFSDVVPFLLPCALQAYLRQSRFILALSYDNFVVLGNGGEVLLLLKKGASFLVAPADFIAKGGFKLDTAKKYGVSILSLEQLDDLIYERRSQYAPAGVADAGSAGEADAGAALPSSDSSESETASIAAFEPAHVESGSTTLSTSFTNFFLKPSSPSINQPVPFTTTPTAVPEPQAAPLAVLAQAAPVEEQLSLFGETESAPSVESDTASVGGLDSADSDPWFVAGEATSSAEPSSESAHVSAPATESALIPVTTAPVPSTPPEERIFIDATGAGWRRKEVFARKREVKKIQAALTDFDRYIMGILNVNESNFPATIAAPTRVVPTGLPGMKSLEEQFDVKKRSKAFENKSLSVINPNASWVAVVMNDPSIRKKIIPPSYVGQKIYVSGILFDDLIAKTEPLEVQKKKLEKLLDRNRRKGLMSKKKMKKKLEKPIVVWTTDQLAAKVKQRRQLVKKVFERFGKVIDVQEQWDDSYIFVTYKSKDDAETAVKTLKNSDARKAIIREIKEDLISKKEDTSVAPRHDFYVRWPEYYTKWKAKRREKEKEERKSKQAESRKGKKKNAKADEAAAASSSSPATPGAAPAVVV